MLDKVFTHNADDIHSLAGLFALFLGATGGKKLLRADSYGHAVMISRFDPESAILMLKKIYESGDARPIKLLLQLLRRTGKKAEYLELRKRVRADRVSQESERSPS